MEHIWLVHLLPPSAGTSHKNTNKQQHGRRRRRPLEMKRSKQSKQTKLTSSSDQRSARAEMMGGPSTDGAMMSSNLN